MSAAIPALYQLITVAGLVVLARTRRFGVFRTTQLLAFLVLPALLQASLGGFVASSAMILWGSSPRWWRSRCSELQRSIGWLLAFFAELVLLALLDPRLAQNPAALPGFRDHVLRAERRRGDPERLSSCSGTSWNSVSGPTTP